MPQQAIKEPQRFQQAIAQIDAANAEDPNFETVEGGRYPKELLYGQRMSAMLARFATQADETMQLAVRAQHIRRWCIPRNTYPLGRQGYLQWRTALYSFHAETTAALLLQLSYDEATIARVKAAIGKKGIKVNPDAQLVEDVSALVFLEHYWLTFAANQPAYTEDKWLNILRKTWLKMSEAARVFALSGQLDLPEHFSALITKAIVDKENA